MDRTYCYEGTNVLKNKFGIMDNEVLYEIERELTSQRLYELYKEPIKGSYDLKHLQNIHKYIFQDIYEWAGEIRTVEIAKGYMFCPVINIPSQSQIVFSELQELFALDDDKFISKVAYCFSEINAIHPFREGNGRANREFIRCLIEQTGRKIFFSNTNRSEMILASQRSLMCDYSLMENIFKKCIRSR